MSEGIHGKPQSRWPISRTTMQSSNLPNTRLSQDMLFKSEQSLILSGDKERFKELLHTRLIECGWRDQIQMLCRQVVKERGVQNITVEELVGEVTSKGRALVPDAVKKELLQKIKSHFLEEM